MARQKQKSNETSIDRVGAIIALGVMGVYAFSVVAPYFMAVDSEILPIIDRNKGTVDTITVMVVSFFFGANIGRRKDQEITQTIADTANKAQKTISETAHPGKVMLEAGDKVEVKAEEDK